MKNLKKILVAFFFLGIIVVAGWEFLCRLEVKCKNCREVSKSKNESINGGFYLGEYKALTKRLKLKNHDFTVEFQDAWYELEWYINSDICICQFKEIRKGEYNIIFPFQTSNKDKHLFSMIPIFNGSECSSCGGMGKNKKEISISSIPDTIEIQIKEMNPKIGVGWNEGGLKGDIIKYVRK